MGRDEGFVKPFLEWLKKKSRDLKQQIFALYFAYKNPATPWYAKVFAGLVIAYAFSPIDLIPDFIPILGYVDDLVLVPIGIWIAIRMIPENVLEEARLQASSESLDGNPRNWMAAVIVILIWIGSASLAIYWIYQLIMD